MSKLRHKLKGVWSNVICKSLTNVLCCGMHVARYRESNKDKVKKEWMVSQTAWHLHTKVQMQLLGWEVTKLWIAGSCCQEKDACEDWMALKYSWWYTVKAHLGSYLTYWRQIRVPLVIFHPPTARGIEIPRGNSSVCLSNCTVQTACPNFASFAGQQ